MVDSLEGYDSDAKARKVQSIEHKIAARRIRREVFFEPTREQVRAVLVALGIVKNTPPPHRSLRIVKGRGRWC